MNATDNATDPEGAVETEDTRERCQRDARLMNAATALEQPWKAEMTDAERTFFIHVDLLREKAKAAGIAPNLAAFFLLTRMSWPADSSAASAGCSS